MPMLSIQPSFAAGELAPALWARVDLAKYHVGAKKLRNFFVLASGGAANRPGTAFIGRCKNSTLPVRLIPFQFNTLQTYILEFGHQYMRVIMNGGYVLEPSFTIASVTSAAPGVVTTTANHGYGVGDWVFITGVTGMTQINSSAGNVYLVASVTATSLTLTDLDGNAINTTAFGAYVSGGAIARIYTMPTLYAGTDLALLKFTQSADVMTFCHPSYAPQNLTRTAHWAWTLTAISFTAQVTSPTGLSLLGTNPGSGFYYSYVVTAVTYSPAEEGMPCPAVTMQSVELDQNTGVAIRLSWNAVSGADCYRIYKANPVVTTSTLGGIPTGAAYGYIGTAQGTSFVDTNIGSDFTQTPPQAQDPFSSGNNPGCVSFFQERQCFAGSDQWPETLWMSQPGAFYNMNVSDPSLDTDAITITINSRQVNAIKHLVSVNALLALTASGAFKISGGAVGAAITPSSISSQPQAYNGCSDVPPIIINYDILYVSAMGARIRDLSYNFYADIYTGSDMTVLSPHLFFGHQILEWTYAEDPFNLIWAVREDGILLGFTYLKEQDVYAWTRHDTQGQFLSVASVPEDQEEGVYMVVNRTIPGINGGNPVKYVERLHSRNFLTNGEADITQAWFVDCGLQYSGAAVNVVSGLNQLNGADVVALADGNVVNGLTVTGGAVTLPHAASTVTVGLPYTAELQTLDLEIAAPTIQGRRKKISAVTLRLENTRGLKIGYSPNNLAEIKERHLENYGQPITLTTGDERVVIPQDWNTRGDLYIRQDNPLPASVLAIIPEVNLGSN